MLNVQRAFNMATQLYIFDLCTALSLDYCWYTLVGRWVLSEYADMVKQL